MNEQAIIHTRQSGYYNLHFGKTLEPLFADFLFHRLRGRLGIVNLVALGFFVVYSLLDYLIFPFEVASWTIPIRLFLVAPVIIISTIINFKTQSPQMFFSVYTLSYIVCGFAVVAIILIAHSNGVMVPYDGLFLVLSYGYFVMSIPFRHVVASSWLIFILYAMAEIIAGLPPEKLYLNLFFLAGANLIGSVGAYIQEHNLRGSFLNHQLLHLRQIEADRENKAKTRFIATASHDLRQPLNAMNLLLEGMPEPPPDDHESARIRLKLRRSLDQLNGLLGGLFDISRLNLGVIKPHISTFDLHEVVDRILDEQAMNQEPGLSMNCNVPAGTGVSSDAVLLERVIRNLISNAAKHAEASLVKVSTELVIDNTELAIKNNEVSPGNVVLTIRDDGRGIPLEDQERVFQKFQQVRRSNGRPASGLGLGLAIVKQLCDLLDISLHLDSQEAKGTLFRLVLPAAELTTADRGQSHSAKEALVLQGVRIWLVEDDASNREALAGFIRKCGAIVEAMEGYEEFSDFLDQNESKESPDLVLTDYRLGNNRTGLSVVKRVRQGAPYFVPAIVLSADVEKVRHLSEGNMDMVFLAKPVTPARLLGAIRHQLGRIADRRGRVSA
ncbi:hybrid sensor histidine kinase/response regulator [Hahella ganghwensis]|uniref:hybrid sensor histidine kinase/response regulator n=1 Tax=Hahella ganghwensis TaxID=286420 RepID=UPI000363EE1E|nr:hybrid sensor histidine kinase/response regulator [Hahella ganghwensis]